MFFHDANTGWIVGVKGRIMRTVDGGKTWKRLPSGSSDVLSNVYFVSAKVGWICGRMGLILKTTDGGDTWIKQQSGTGVWLTGLHFVDETTGWVSGQGLVLQTTDGGKTWTVQSACGAGAMYVRFADANNGWATGGSILRTTTGGLPGAVWAKKQPDGTPANYGHLVVTKKSQGYLLAEHPDSRIGIHIKTSDGKPNVGDYIYIHGKVATENSEKIIAADSIDIQCAGWGILPAK